VSTNFHQGLWLVESFWRAKGLLTNADMLQFVPSLGWGPFMKNLITDLVQVTWPDKVVNVEELTFLQKCQLFGQITEDTAMDVPLRGHDLFHAARTNRPCSDFFAPPKLVTHKTKNKKVHEFWNLNILVVSDSTLQFRKPESAHGYVQQALHEWVHGIREITNCGCHLPNLRGIISDHVFAQNDAAFQYLDEETDFKVVVCIWNCNDMNSKSADLLGNGGPPAGQYPTRHVAACSAGSQPSGGFHRRLRAPHASGLLPRCRCRR